MFDSSFLVGITEELEEKDIGAGRGLGADGSSGGGGVGGGAIAGAAAATDGASIYEDYKFLVRDEIESLGMENLVGTRLLRGYMLASSTTSASTTASGPWPTPSSTRSTGRGRFGSRWSGSGPAASPPATALA